MPGVCPRCNRDVYFAEERLALGKVWHTFCFSCHKCQKLLDSCTVATHRGELFCKNCYARSFPIATLTSSLRTDSTIFPDIIAISETVPTRAAVQIYDSSSDCDCCCSRSESNVILENSLNQRGNHRYESDRLRGGGVNEQEKKDCIESENTNIDSGTIATACKATSSPIAVTAWYNRQHSNLKRPFNYQVSTKSRLCRPETTPAVELHAASVNNNVDNRPLSRKSEQQDRSRGHQESFEQTRSVLHEKQQQQDQFQNAVQLAKDTDFSKGMSSTENQLSTVENRTRVILSTCESPFSRESRTTVSPDIPSRQKCPPLAAASRSPCVPFRRRVSFSDAVVGAADHGRRTIMQNDLTKSCRDNGGRPDNSERETFYDIWQADESANRSDDGYENAPRIDNYSENRVSDCTSNKGRDSTENIDETVANDGHTRDEGGDKSDVRPGDRIAENTATRADEDDTMSNEDASNFVYKDINSIGHDEYRMRGGCGGCCGALSNTDDTTSGRGSVRRSSQDHCYGGGSCCCCCCCDGGGGGGGGGGGRLVETNESCTPESGRCDDGGVKTACTAIRATACTVPSSRCCCRCAAQVCRRAGVCKKAARCNEMPACTTGSRGCDNSGCCGGGCRGGCGKPGQICAPSSSRGCSSTPAYGRPRSSRGRSPCARPRCPAQSPCPPADRVNGRSSGCRGCCGGYECGSPRCRSTIGGGCCINDGAKCGTDGVRCRLKLPVVCECLGGGLDCRRCGRKVYQAEMQIASGVPYHSICFSCFCCRKPLEPLTYQENCGEIYCKQCYVRNFGPQGYGYGVGAGVLQTPM